MKLTELLGPWLEENYKDEIWIVKGLDWSGGFIRGQDSAYETIWPTVVDGVRTFAEVHDDIPLVRTFRLVRSKDRQRTSSGLYRYNYTPVYKNLRPADPRFLMKLKGELDLMKAHEW